MTINIMYRYPGNEPEVVDTAEDMKEAKYLLTEYRMAYGGVGSLWLKKDTKDARTEEEDDSL
jgi:streptomycin 6-kinase